jgi:hypothetical protein
MTSNLWFQINACSSLKFDSVLGTEPASESRIRSCCGSTPGIRFYCKPVTLVRCREIRGEIGFSGRVVGKWLCEMTSAFIIKGLRGARALRLFCGRSSFPPPDPYFGGFHEVSKLHETLLFLIFSPHCCAGFSCFLSKNVCYHNVDMDCAFHHDADYCILMQIDNAMG